MYGQCCVNISDSPDIILLSVCAGGEVLKGSLEILGRDKDSDSVAEAGHPLSPGQSDLIINSLDLSA